MESARARVTKSKLFIDDVNPLVYLNHVFFKKYGFAFNYDSAAEAKFLFSKDGLLRIAPILRSCINRTGCKFHVASLKIHPFIPLQMILLAISNID